MQVVKKVLINHFWLIPILIIGGLVRFYQITYTPPALNWDEVSHGFNAFSILKTGRDEWGELMPVIFRAYGDYKLPVYIYLTALSEFFFGLNALAVRLPSLLAGLGTIALTYFLARELMVDKKNRVLVAILSGLLVAIEPWSLFLSRGAFEANLALFFFVFGLYLFVKAANKRSGLMFCSSFIFLGLTVWTYNSYRIFTPLMLIFLVMVFRKVVVLAFRASKKLSLLGFLILATFFMPMFYQLTSFQGRARYTEVRILDSGVIARIEEARSQGGSRLIHNKATYFLSEFSKNYFAHLSPEFLFIDGGSHHQFSVPGRGLLYSVNLVFFLLGIYATLFVGSLVSDKSRLILLFGFLAAPVASSLTREAPHVLRFITVLPIPMVFCALGFVFVLSKLSDLKVKRNILPNLIVGAYFLMVASSLINYLNVYFGEYRRSYSWSWQYGYKELALFIGENYDNYDKIVVTKKYGEPHEFLLFYFAWEPEKYLADEKLNRFYQSNWYWVDSFGKFSFVNDWQVNEPGKGEYVFNLESKKQVTCEWGQVRCLLATSPGNVPAGWTQISQIKFLDGSTAFEIYENN